MGAVSHKLVKIGFAARRQVVRVSAVNESGLEMGAAVARLTVTALPFWTARYNGDNIAWVFGR